MRWGIISKISIGFAAVTGLFLVLWIIAAFQMHQTFEELQSVHQNYLSLNRLVTQAKSLVTLQDERVRRMTSESDPAIQKHLRKYLLRNFPLSLEKKIDELQLAIVTLQKKSLAHTQTPFLLGLENSVNQTQTLAKNYAKEVTAIAENIGESNLNRERLKLPEENNQPNDLDIEKDSWQTYKSSYASLHTQLLRLSLALDNKLGQTLRSAAQKEEDNVFGLWIMIAVALSVSLFGLWWIRRAFHPLELLVQSARAIRDGNLNIQVPVDTDDVLGALGTEFNNLARALQDRETALSKNTSEISELRDFFGDIIRSVQVGILVLDKQNHVLLINPAAQSLFSLPPVQSTGQPLDISQLESPLVPLFEKADQVRETSEPLAVNGVAIKNNVLDFSIMPIRDASGFSLGHVLLLAEDVTTQETTKQKLVESERLAAIGRIAAQITHEIRNPLSAIGLNIELLEDDIPALPDQRQKEARAVLGAVAGEIDRLTAITEGYLRVAKLPAGQNQFGDIGDLLADLCAFSQEEAARQEVRLELRVGQNLNTIPFDEGRLRQALLNLLQNALSVAGRGGTVRLSALTEASGGVKVTIADTGPGISLENKEKIFDPFFTTRKKGTGLGLTLTKEILHEHGTSVEISDSNLGGAAFSFVLPPKSEKAALESQDSISAP